MFREKEGSHRKSGRRKLKIVVVILVVLVVLVLATLFSLERLVNRNKGYLLAQAERTLGRRVTVEEVGVALWGGLGVRLKGVALADDEAFSSEDFLRAADIQLNVKFFPLLRGDLQITRLSVHQPAIVLSRDEAGRLNVASLGQPAEAEKPPLGAEAPEIPLFITTMEMTDGEVRYSDRQAGVDLRVSQVELTLKDLSLDKPVSVALRAATLGADKSNLVLTGRFGPLGKTVKELPVSGDVRLEAVALENLSRFAAVKELIPPDLTAEGPVSMTAHFEGTPERLSLKGSLEAGESVVRFGDYFRKREGIPLSLAVESEVTEQMITLSSAGLRLHTLELTGTGQINLGEVPSLRLALDSSRVDLAGWDGIFPAITPYKLSGGAELHTKIQGEVKQGEMPNLDGSLALTSVGMALPHVTKPVADLYAAVTFTGGTAQLKETSMRLGKSVIQLEAEAQSLTPLALTYQIFMPELDLADVQAAEPGAQIPGRLMNVAGEGQIGFDHGLLAGRGNLSSPRGAVYGIEYGNLGAEYSIRENAYGIDDFSVQLLNGNLKGKGEYSFKQAPPRFELVSRVESVDLATFFKTVLGGDPRHIRGRTNINLTLTGSGEQWEQVSPSLQGQGDTEVVEGALLDLNIAEGVLSGITGVPGFTNLLSPRVRGDYPLVFGSHNTQFDTLRGSVTVREGKVNLGDLRMVAPDWAVYGKGWVDFSRNLDFKGTISFSPTFSTELAKGVKEIKYILNDENQLEIPFTLAGTLPSVTPAPDLAHVGGLLKRSVIDKGIEKIKQPELKGLLRKLGPLKRDDR